jgi:hypothetical protein
VGDATRQTIAGPGIARFTPVFFPDGRRIAYWRREGAQCAIVERELATGRERVLLDCELKPRPRFDLSPDGRWLAFVGTSRPQFPAALHVLEVDRGPPRALTTPSPASATTCTRASAPTASASPSSAAANRIARRGSCPATIRPMRARSRKVEGLTYGAAWLGNDGPLLVAADWLGFRALNSLDLATGELKLVGARGARFPDVGPRGRSSMRTRCTRQTSSGPHRGEAARAPLWPSTRYTNQPEFSPDGLRIAFASNRDGTDAIYVASLVARRGAWPEARSTATCARTGRPMGAPSTR